MLYTDVAERFRVSVNNRKKDIKSILHIEYSF